MSAALFRDAVDVSPARHAALVLHGLAAADQAWVLAQLPQEQTLALQALLGELADLDPDRTVLGLAAIGDGVKASHDVDPLTDEERLKNLAGDDLDRLARQLGAASADFVALCMRVRPWPWRAQMLERLPPTCRQRVRASIAAAQERPPAGPRRQAALMHGLRCMLDAAPPSVAHPAEHPKPRVSGRRAWLSWLRRSTA